MKQDLDPDPSMSKRTKDLREEFQRTDINPESYIYGVEDLDELLNQQTDFEIQNRKKLDWRMKRKHDELVWKSDNPPVFINKPLNRKQARLKYMRKLTKADFNWKDTALLTQFLNSAGKIKNRYQTRLPDKVHKYMAKVIKHSRNMGLIPYVGPPRPTDKLSLRSFYEELEEFNRKSIDPATGRLYFRGEIDMSDPDPERTHYPDRFERSPELESEGPDYIPDPEKLNKLRNFAIDQVAFIPSTKQMQWMEAQSQVKEQRDKRLNVNQETPDNMKPPKEKHGIDSDQPAKIDDNLLPDINIDDLPHWFIHEKALDISNLDSDRTEKHIDMELDMDQEIEESAEQIQSNIDNIMSMFKKHSRSYADQDYSEYANKTVEPIADQKRDKILS